MTTRTRLATLLTGAVLAATPMMLVAQGTTPPKTTPSKAAPAAKAAEESQAKLKKEAKITLADAKVTALKEVPGGKITESGLEREDGKLIYSFDIKVAGKKGVEEVAIDAITGAVVNKVHESPKDMAKEATADKAAAAKAAAAKAKRDSIKKAGGGL